MSPPLAALVAALAIGAGPAPSSVRLAAPGLTLVDVDRARGAFFLEYFCEQLSHQGPIRITTEGEIAALVGFERERELLGCSDATKQSCFVELADALGVDGLIVGNVARVGSGFAATIKVVSSRDGDPYGSRSTRVKTEDELLDWLQQSARELAPAVVVHRHGGAALVPTGPATGPAPTPLGRAEPPALPPALPSSSGSLNSVRLSLPIFRGEYLRRFWPRALLGVRLGASMGLTGAGGAVGLSLGGTLSAVGRLELGARDVIHTELVASLGGGYAQQGSTGAAGAVVTATAGAALAWGGARLGLEGMVVSPLESAVPFHVALLPELGWVFDF